MSDYPATPELDKQHEAIQNGAHKIGEFLDWLESANIVLAIPSGYGGDLAPYYGRTKLRLIADFYGIDLKKVEAERQAILEHIREQHQAEEKSE